MAGKRDGHAEAESCGKKRRKPGWPLARDIFALESSLHALGRIIPHSNNVFIGSGCNRKK